MTPSQETKRELAQKRVVELKGFFRHLRIFVIVNGILFAMRMGWLIPVLPDWFPTEQYYFQWVNLNIAIWAVILAVHALTLFRHKFTPFKKWEERKIKEFMDKEGTESKKYK